MYARAPKTDLICERPCDFKIAFIRWLLLTFTFDRFTFQAYRSVVLREIKALTKSEVRVAAC